MSLDGWKGVECLQYLLLCRNKRSSAFGVECVVWFWTGRLHCLVPRPSSWCVRFRLPVYPESVKESVKGKTQRRNLQRLPLIQAHSAHTNTYFRVFTSGLRSCYQHPDASFWGEILGNLKRVLNFIISRNFNTFDGRQQVGKAKFASYWDFYGIFLRVVGESGRWAVLISLTLSHRLKTFAEISLSTFGFVWKPWFSFGVANFRTFLWELPEFPVELQLTFFSSDILAFVLLFSLIYRNDLTGKRQRKLFGSSWRF